MSPTYEATVRFSLPLRGVVRAAPSMPLPPLPERALAPAPSPPPSPPIIRLEDPAEVERRAIEKVLAGLQGAAAQFEARYQSLLAEMRQVAIELAIAVAGRLLHDKARADELAMEVTVRQVVERLPARRDVVVYLHPDDLALLRQRLGDPLLLAEAPLVQFRPSPTLARGSCRGEAGGGVGVLADLEEQLADLRRHLLESVADAEPQPG